MKKTAFLKSIVFLLLFALCFRPVNRVLSQPLDRRSYQWVAGFYEEPRETLDAVYIGSSNVYAFWNPLIAWERYGIAVHSYASNDQPFSAMPYLIDEVRKTQPNALIIANLNSLHDTVIKETHMHYLVGNMPMSLNRLKLTKHLAEEAGYSFTESLEFYFPIIRFHERWSELKQADFEFEINGLKGAATYANHLQGIQNITDRYVTGMEPEEPAEDVRNTLERLLDYCDEEQVNILFVIVPRAEENVATANTFLYLKEYVEDRGYPVLDLLDKTEEIGLETARDYYNDTHTNLHGSIKFTRYLSEYLIGQYGFRDKRGEAAYASWDAGREAYSQYLDPQVLDFEYDGSGRDYTLAEPGALKARVLQDGISVSWDPVEGADGYAVYRKTDSGGWKRAAEMAETGYLDSNAAKGGTVTYRVVAFRIEESGEIRYGKFAYNGVSVKT